MSNVDISIIIPVHNCESCIWECLSSASNQIDISKEIIVVDDCSSDRTTEIVCAFKKGCSEVTLIKLLNNRGPGFARNVGIVHSIGEYIAFLDADDYYPSKTALSSLFKVAKPKGYNIVGGSLMLETVDVNTGKKVVSRHINQTVGIHAYKKFQFDGAFYRFIYRRCFLSDNQIAFPESYRFEDPPFLVDAMIASKIFYGVETFVYVYRRIENKIYWDDFLVRDRVSNVMYVLNKAKENRLDKLQYLMAKNFQDCLKSKMIEVGLLSRLRLTLKICFMLDWSIVFNVNKQKKVKVSPIKMLYLCIKGSKYD